MKLQYTGKVEDGKLVIFNKSRLTTEVAVFDGKDILLTIQKKRKIRSHPLNRYYWGVVVSMITSRFNELGNEVDAEDVHEFLKIKFADKDIILPGGEIEKGVQSTAKMTNTEFLEYLENIFRFSAEVLDIVIPDPVEI